MRFRGKQVRLDARVPAPASAGVDIQVAAKERASTPKRSEEALGSVPRALGSGVRSKWRV